MARLAQLVRASGCGPEGHGFKPHISPHCFYQIYTILRTVSAGEKFIIERITNQATCETQAYILSEGFSLP